MKEFHLLPSCPLPCIPLQLCTLCNLIGWDLLWPVWLVQASHHTANQFAYYQQPHYNKILNFPHHPLENPSCTSPSTSCDPCNPTGCNFLWPIWLFQVSNHTQPISLLSNNRLIKIKSSFPPTNLLTTPPPLQEPQHKILNCPNYPTEKHSCASCQVIGWNFLWLIWLVKTCHQSQSHSRYTKV